MIEAKTKARFFEPMLLLATSSLPEGDDWEYELKLDGYRAIEQWKCAPALQKQQRFSSEIPAIAKGLQKLPDETVIDGEVVALDDSGPTVVQHAAELWIIDCADFLLRIRCADTGESGCEN